MWSTLSCVLCTEYVEDDSRCSQFSERLGDEPDLLMEVETGSNVSETVSVQETSTVLYPSSAVTRKPTRRTEDRNKSRIRKRLLVETPAVQTEDGSVSNSTCYLSIITPYSSTAHIHKTIHIHKR